MNTRRPSPPDSGRHARTHSDAGFSLAEVMIASLIVLVVSAALYSTLAQTQVFWESYSGDVEMRQRARVALDGIASELRMIGYDIGNLTEAVTQAGDYSIQFVGDVDAGDDSGPCDAAMESAYYGGVERITYTLDAPNRTVNRAVDCWTGGAWIVGSAASPVLTDIDAANPIFRYLDETGAQIPLGGGTLDTDARTDVRSVIVRLELVDLDAEQQVGDTNTNLILEKQVRLHNFENGLEPDEVVGG